MNENAFERGMRQAGDLLAPFITDERRDRLRAELSRLLTGRVVTHRELAKRAGTRSWRYDEAREFTFTRPDYYNELPEGIERLIGTHHCEQPSVLEVADVVLWSDVGFKMTQAGEYIVDGLGEGADHHAASSLASDVLYGLRNGVSPGFRAHTKDPQLKLEAAVPLLGKWAKNYTHWKQECLTLLRGVEVYRSRTGTDPTLLIPTDPPAYIPESLELLGYPEPDYIEMPEGRIEVARLVLPSMARCLSDTSEDFIRTAPGFEWIRSRTVRNVDVAAGDYSPRVLISRADSSRRRISNREAVEQVLDEFGFTTYVPGRMSYREQVALFSQAEFVVGVHGAGMINTIYGENPAVLELYGNHFLPANYEIAQGLGNPYGCLGCETVTDDNDIHVDGRTLTEAVISLERAASERPRQE